MPEGRPLSPEFHTARPDEEGKKKLLKPLTPEETRRAEAFFAEHLTAIQDYARAVGMELRAGRGWAIDLEHKVMTYDPSWFVEQEFSPAEAMWATSHEMEHFRDWQADPEAFDRLFSRMKTRRRIHVLYNCLNDILVNRAVDQRFPAHQPTKQTLYRERLFPESDYRDKPAHLQYIYAILRERMLPEEALALAPEVRAEVDRLRDIDGSGTDLIELLTRPGERAAIRYEIIRDYIEPVYERFYRDDLERKKEQKKEERGAAGGEGGEEVEAGELDFAPFYDEFDQKSLPHPLPDKEAAAAVNQEARRRQNERTAADSGARGRGQFQAEHDLDDGEMRELEGPYRMIYREIEPLITPLREVFERIIERRKERVRRLSKLREEGLLIRPELLAQAYTDLMAGAEPRAELTYEVIERDVQKPNNLEVTLVTDLSGSMAGAKAREQLKAAVLIMEALSEFEERLRREREERAVELQVATELRGFGTGDVLLKPLSPTLPFKDRIRAARQMRDPSAEATNDFLALEQVEGNLDEERKKKISEDELRKLVILITDGGSSNESASQRAKESLSQAGVIVRAIQIGEPTDEEKEIFRRVWGPDGAAVRRIEDLPDRVLELLRAFLKDV